MGPVLPRCRRKGGLITEHVSIFLLCIFDNSPAAPSVSQITHLRLGRRKGRVGCPCQMCENCPALNGVVWKVFVHPGLFLRGVNPPTKSARFLGRRTEGTCFFALCSTVNSISQ
jgi:hypothetical protein